MKDEDEKHYAALNWHVCVGVDGTSWLINLLGFGAGRCWHLFLWSEENIENYEQMNLIYLLFYLLDMESFGISVTLLTC